jgi:phosphoesterase RecJ-like protein
MDGSIMDEIEDGVYQGALAIVLDCGASALVSDERYKLAEKTARIDHHIYQETFTDLEVVDTSFESCCGEITQLGVEAGWAFSPASAKALFTGMVTDSGRFRYDSTSAQTFRLAAVLMEQPFDTAEIYSQLYADEYKYLKLRAQFILKMQFTNYRVAYIYTTKEEVASYGVDHFTISRGMVNVMGEIRGVDIWVNFTESEEGVLCELRSNKYNINGIAKKYGGGGHAKASGATVKDREAAMEMLNDLMQLTEVEA